MRKKDKKFDLEIFFKDCVANLPYKASAGGLGQKDHLRV